MLKVLVRHSQRNSDSWLPSGWAAALVAVCLSAASPARATVRFWSGAGADGNWSTAANWSGTPPNPGDDLIFNAGAARLVNTNNYATNTAFSSITFLGTNYVIYGNPIALTSNPGISAQHGGGNNTFNPDIQLNASQVFECTAAGGSLILNGDINLNGFSLTNNATGSLQLAGVIGGIGNVIKNGAGTLTFSGGSANTYTNATIVNAGTLRLGKFALGGSIQGPLIVGDGTGGANADVVVLDNDEQIADTADVTVNSSGLLDIQDYDETIGSLAGSGNVSMLFGDPAHIGDLFTGNNNSSTLFSGVITGLEGQLWKLGTGTFTLTGNNTYTGSTELLAGTLIVNGSQPNSIVNVAGGCTLGGSGTVGIITVAGGVIAPGASPGVLSSSNVFLNASSAFKVDLNGTIAGTGFDQLNVRGTNNLAGATLIVTPAFPGNDAPSEGALFTILNNDGVDAITGTFAGLSNGSVFSAGGMQFRISYAGGDGNDVTLTVTNTPLRQFATLVSAGNGDGIIDPNECDLLSIVITNRATNAVTGISATLMTTTPGAVVVQPFSSYPDAPAGATRTNLVPFQITTQPWFVCGDPINLVLGVTTADAGGFSTSFTVPTGGTGAAAQFDNNTFTAIPDPGTVESSLVASNIVGALKHVSVSMYVTHPADGDLSAWLISPDAAMVLLTSANGGTGDDYGTDCVQPSRTTFDDAGVTSITAGGPAFVGTFRPQGSLSNFSGLSGPSVNGTWKLRLTDGFGGSGGTLRCWSLFLSPLVCAPGGGVCELCPNVTLFGAVNNGSPFQSDRLTRDGLAGTCDAPKFCPGPLGFGSEYFDSHTFRNGPSNTCITVTLVAPNADLHSAAYLDSYSTTDVCTNYLADTGDSTIGVVFPPGPRTYSFNLASNAVFIVVVNSVFGYTGPYQLTVTGGDCRPVLQIAPASPTQVKLDWTTAAAGYQLERTNSVAGGGAAWQPVTNAPVVGAGRFNVTNSTAGTNNYYRLRKL